MDRNDRPPRPSILTMGRLATSAFAALAAGFGFAHGLRAEGFDPVAVAAGADAGYVQRKFAADGKAPRSETYLFAKGSHFGGYLRDPSLEHEQFMAIAQTLAPDLAEQRFFPAPASKVADLLIVIHWGLTSVENDTANSDAESLMKDLGTQGSGKQDMDRINQDLDFMRANSALSSQGPEANAQLLGFSSELKSEEYKSIATATGATYLDHVLRDDLMDDRYFVILMAYDMKSLRVGDKGRKPKLLWSTHFSMRAVGHSFTAALPIMGKAASGYFGHQVDQLVLDAGTVPEGKVEVGEPRTVEEKKN
jgi:hypothetical protein